MRMRESSSVKKQVDQPEQSEKINITAHIDSQTWFCVVDDDRVLCNHILEIEERFRQADNQKRVISELVPEANRRQSAPFVGTVEHVNGTLVDIDIDLQDWYDL